MRGDPSLLGLQRSEDALRGKRYLAQTRTGSVKNGIGDRGSDGNDGRLASAKRRHFRPVDEHNFNFRDLLKTDDRVAVPIEIGLPGGIEVNLFQQSPAHPLHYISFDL